MDIGGKKYNKRGNFRPPMESVLSWHYLNLDKSSNPDYCCNAEDIPVSDSTYDFVLLCEILEHLENPEKVLREAYRILNARGVFVLSVPFLYPVHADPFDYQRWTKSKLVKTLDGIGFKNVNASTMGGVGSVMYDLLFFSSWHLRSNFWLKILRIIMPIVKPFFRLVDSGFKGVEECVTTGYFIVAKK